VGGSTTEAAQAAGGVTHTYQAIAAARGLVSTSRAGATASYRAGAP
jgi:hypothetical protein